VVAALFGETVGTNERPALQPRVRRRVQQRQRSHPGALREYTVRNRHDEPIQHWRRARLEVRCGVARVSGKAADRRASCPEPAIELEREEQVGELRLRVRAPALVTAAALKVVEVDPPRPMCATGHGDDTSVFPLLHRADQKTREGKVAEVVRPELELEPIRCLSPGRSHYTGIVDKQIEPIVVGSKPVGKRPNGSKVGEVQAGDFDTRARNLRFYLAESRCPLLGVATGENHLRTSARELACRLQS